ncbi:hypothetical protein ACFYRC_33700 [Streptomyces sp. NPDC005279]|uniref:hypothetical protein n=1 Tax=Streptomyces sp. NPDC005279 TaxID=3364712 RepID=UPI00367CCEA1
MALPLTGGGRVARPLVLLLGTLGVLLAAAQVGVIAGSPARSFDHVYSMESIILLPLGFLGGVFHSVRQSAAARAPRRGPPPCSPPAASSPDPLPGKECMP